MAVSVTHDKWPIFLPPSQHGTTPAAGETAKLASAGVGSPALGRRHRGGIGAESPPTRGNTSFEEVTEVLGNILLHTLE